MLPAGTLANTGPFNNVQYIYWTATEYAPAPVVAWYCTMGSGMGSGSQDYYNKTDSSNRYAWAVQAGDVGTVPVPAAALLFGAARIGLAGLKRKK